MEQILLILIVGAMNILCFYYGAKTGQKVIKKEDIELIKNPIKKYQEIQEQKEEEKENEVLETILHNIDSYDGTEAGQKEIPR